MVQGRPRLVCATRSGASAIRASGGLNEFTAEMLDPVNRSGRQRREKDHVQGEVPQADRAERLQPTTAEIEQDVHQSEGDVREAQPLPARRDRLARNL